MDYLAPDNADSTYPTVHNDSPKDQNTLLFVPHTWEHCQMHDESLHTPPALHTFKALVRIKCVPVTLSVCGELYLTFFSVHFQSSAKKRLLIKC